MMKLQLTKGKFCKKDALDLVTKLISIKIKFHEEKVLNHITKEDCEISENRIKQLQKELYDARNHIEGQNEPISMNSEIEL